MAQLAGAECPHCGVALPAGSVLSAARACAIERKKTSLACKHCLGEVIVKPPATDAVRRAKIRWAAGSVAAILLALALGGVLKPLLGPALGNGVQFALLIMVLLLLGPLRAATLRPMVVLDRGKTREELLSTKGGSRSTGPAHSTESLKR